MFRTQLNLITGEKILVFARTKALLLKQVQTEIHNGSIDGFNSGYKNTLFIFEVESEDSTKVLDSCFAYWNGQSFLTTEVIDRSLIYSR